MIKKFEGQYRFLSNFYPVEVFFDGEKYSSTEHGYVAAKTLDKEIRKKIQAVEKAGDVKKLGREIVLRPDWEAEKVWVMENLVRQKFSHPEFTEKLLATGDQEIVEGNTWHDNFWGSCTCKECGDKGKNNLGKMLMQLRESLRTQPLLTFKEK